MAIEKSITHQKAKAFPGPERIVIAISAAAEILEHGALLQYLARQRLLNPGDNYALAERGIVARIAQLSSVIMSALGDSLHKEEELTATISSCQ